MGPTVITNGDGVIIGGIFADNFSSLDGNDIIIGAGGSDTLDGGAGNDVLIGVNVNEVLVDFETDGAPVADISSGSIINPGRLEVDRLTGGEGADLFVLGDNNNVYYNDRLNFTAGTLDFARLLDFDPSEDVIQLKGSSSDYSLKVSGSTGNTEIFLESSGFLAKDELIAVVHGNTNLNLNASYFEYV